MEQVKNYEEQGWLFLPGHFSATEVKVLKTQLEIEFSATSERKVNDKEGGVIRSVYGSHAKNKVFQCLARARAASHAVIG